MTELTFWKVVSCCQNATKQKIFYKMQTDLSLLLSVRISEVVDMNLGYGFTEVC